MNPQNSATFMRVVAYGFLLFAFLWGLAPYVPINAPSRIIIDIIDWPYGDAPALLDRNTMWLTSIGAGLVVMVSIMLLGIVVPALESGNRPVIRTTIWALVGWYLVDSIGSIASGVASNALFNLIFFVAALFPLLRVQYTNELPHAVAQPVSE